MHPAVQRREDQGGDADFAVTECRLDGLPSHRRPSKINEGAGRTARAAAIIRPTLNGTSAMQTRPRTKKARLAKVRRCPKCNKLLRKNIVRCPTCHKVQ
jgi:hypothetical protein